MKFYQKEINLSGHKRGFHLITREILNGIPELQEIKTGILQVFIKHTSASLTINENADPTVRSDFESHFNKFVPEDMPYYQHDYEGSDDMPAHIKSSILGASVMIPVSNGRLNLGTWQGIYLWEHRIRSHRRRIEVSIFGD